MNKQHENNQHKLRKYLPFWELQMRKNWREPTMLLLTKHVAAGCLETAAPNLFFAPQKKQN